MIMGMVGEHVESARNIEDLLESTMRDVSAAATPVSRAPDFSVTKKMEDPGKTEALRILSGLSSWKEGERLLGLVEDVGVRARALAAIFEGITIVRPGVMESLMGSDRTRRRTVGYLKKLDAEGFRGIRDALKKEGSAGSAKDGKHASKKKA